MAERKDSDENHKDPVSSVTRTNDKKAPETEGGKIDVMAECERNLASVRETLNALDRLEDRWKEVQKEFGMKLSMALQITLGVAIPTQLSAEQQQEVLGGKPTLQEICNRLKDGHFKKVVVMSGAGVSVSAGIPDFRSPGSGLYDTLDLAKHDLPSPQAVFEIGHFWKNPKPFFSVVKQLMPGSYRPTPAHYFIRLLADKKLLHRCYTQNIDGLERQAGVPEDDLVEAHGTLAKAACTQCYKSHTVEEVKEAVMKDEIPLCSKCNNVVKPSIVFFGEDLPSRFKALHAADFHTCDLLIIMGTSLKVLPFASLINRVRDTTPRLLLNKERVGSFTLESEGGYRDVAMLQECDKSVKEICELCGWSNKFEALVNPPKAKAPAKSATTASKTTPAKSATKPISSTVKAPARKQEASKNPYTKTPGSKTPTRKSTTTKHADHKH